jgi:hypothetical protein
MGITAFVIYKISTLSLIRTSELDYLMIQHKNRRWILQQMRFLLEYLEQYSRRLSQLFIPARFKCGQATCFTVMEG